MTKVKIICDGRFTRVITPSGDVLIAQNVRFSHNAAEIPMVTLDLIGFEFEGHMPVSSKP